MSAIIVPLEGRPATRTTSSEDLVGLDGNAFVIMGRVRQLLRDAGASDAFLTAYTNEATSGDYAHLLAASIAYLDLETFTSDNLEPANTELTELEKRALWGDR